ncbi:hypothetical protein HA402_016168 [Bradysia odoriphaga]|nr:hypothetical protein HA402_016168 [Bradysia odoriphaga]
MNTTEHTDDNNGVKQDSLTHPPLLDKEIDMFSIPETKQNDDKNACSTPPKPADDLALDTQSQTQKKIEPVLGKERAIKILKAFGSQQKPVKEFHTNVLKTPTRDINKPKREKKSLTPMEKAKATISQIEELKKFKDRTIPTYFGENVVIHHIKVEHPPTETKLDNNKSGSIEKVNREIVGPKTPVDSLEALKVYNNLDVDKQSDDDVISEREEPLMSRDLLDASLKKRKLPTAFDLKTKRAKEKRSKRTSQDSRSSDKKRKRRNKDRKKGRTRDVSSRRSSTSSVKKRSKKRRDSNRDIEISSDKRISSEKRIFSEKRISSEKRTLLEHQSRDHQYERYTKTLPTIKYSPNPHVMRHLSTNGIVDKISASKKKKRSSSKSTVEKRKRKKSSDGSTEKLKVKRRRRSGSKADKSVKKRRKELDRSNEDATLKIKSKKVSNDDAPSKVNERTMDGKSPNSEEYHSNWDNWDSVEATDEMTGSSMENLLQLDTIPLQLNVPKQDRTILFMNDCCAKISEQMNQTTPRMDQCDPTMETPIIVDTTAAKCPPPDLEDMKNGTFNSPVIGAVTTLCSNSSIDKYISKISPEKPITKRNEQPKLNHQPIARLYDEYEQFIMSCVPASNESHSNGDKSSVTSSLFESVTSNDGDEELEALKKSLEMKLNEIEHTDSDDTAKIKVPDQPVQIVKVTSPKPPSNVTNQSSDSESSSTSSSSSDSSSSSTSSSSDKKQRKKKTRKQNAKLPLLLDENMFDLKTSIEDDELSDNELLSKVELLKQQFSEKRKELANKRKLIANDAVTPEGVTKSSGTDALLVSAEKRSAISLKIGGNKTNSIMKPVMFDDDDFTDKLMLEVTPTTLARSRETNKLLIERVIEPGVGLVSSSNSNSLASEIINTKVSRIGMMPNNPIMSDIFPKSIKSVPIENAVVKITSNETVPIDTAEMKKYLNNASSHLDSSDSVASKTTNSIESSKSYDSSPAEIRKGSPTKQLIPPSRSDKRDSSDSNSKNRPLSPYSRSRTKESSKRYSSPPPRHRSPRSRKRSYRSPSPIRKRSRGSPRRSRSPRKSPRRVSPRRLRRSHSPRSKRPVSPVRARTPPMPEKHTNRHWEPPHTTDYTSSTKSVLACDNNVPQPICRLESTHAAPWPDEGNSAFAEYNYQHIQTLAPKQTIEDRNAHTFNHLDQSYDFHRASGPYMGHVQYSTENTSKIPVLNSQENYYFQSHVPPQNMQALPRLHVPSMHVSHIAPTQLSPQPLSVQHPPPQQRIFSNLIEIRQSNVEVERTPFVVKGNVLEIVPKTEAVIVEQTTDSKQEDESSYEVKPESIIELTEEEIERRELKRAELKLKRKQERDKRHLERFMRKEKLKLEIKHLMEVGVHTTDVKKATYNPNAIGGKSILRGNVASANKKSVLFADGVAPGDGTSTSEREDVAPLLRERNKRMTKKKLDSKRRRARREASTIKKDATPQLLEITPFIDPEIENMPPPPPPDGYPPIRLPQPKLKSTPKLIYFHYDPKSNTMCISPFPTDVDIPSYPSNDSPPAASTPDLIPKPKVCFIQPPVFEQQPAPVQGVNPSLPNQNTSTLNSSVGSNELHTTVPPPKPFNQQHQQQPSSNSLPSSPALYSSRQVHSPQNFRGPPPIINPQSVPSQQSPMQMQASPMASQWETFPPNTQIPPIQQPPCAQSWEPDLYPHNQAIRPHIRFNNGNNIVHPRPAHILWEQQRHPNPMYQNQIHSPQHQQQPPPPPPPPQQPTFLPRLNHPRFHQNQPVNVNTPHQPHTNFAFNSKYNYNANSSHTWNNQYRNNH